VAEHCLAPSSSIVEEGDMQIYLLGEKKKEAVATSESHNNTG